MGIFVKHFTSRTRPYDRQFDIRTSASALDREAPLRFSVLFSFLHGWEYAAGADSSKISPAENVKDLTEWKTAQNLIHNNVTTGVSYIGFSFCRSALLIRLWTVRPGGVCFRHWQSACASVADIRPQQLITLYPMKPYRVM